MFKLLLLSASAIRVNVNGDEPADPAVEAVKAADKTAADARETTELEKPVSNSTNGTDAADAKPEAALEDLRSKGNDLILGKSARPTNEEGKAFERAHAYWYYRDLKDWKAEQERQRLIDAGIILPDITDISYKNEGRKFVKPQMTEDERLALEMQAKMSQLNANQANERTNMGGGSGYKPGSRFKRGGPKTDEEIAAEM